LSVRFAPSFHDASKALPFGASAVLEVEAVDKFGMDCGRSPAEHTMDPKGSENSLSGEGR
jgi:hypothetical protein